jgi:hypothetical protein
MLRKLLRSLALVVALFGSVSCDSDGNFIALVCSFDASAKAEPTAVTVEQGSSATVMVTLGGNDLCKGPEYSALTMSVTSGSAAVATGAQGTAPRDFFFSPYPIVVTGVSPGTTTISAKLTSPAHSPGAALINVTVIPTHGTVNVAISGLPAGVAGNVTVGSLLVELKTFTASGTAQMLPGSWAYMASSVTANGVTYDPSPASGVVTITRGLTSNVVIVYAPRPVVTTGTANIQIGGLPGGTSGSVTITGNGVNQTVTSSGAVTLAPGTYTVTAAGASTANNDYADPQASRQVTIVAGQATTVSFVYAIVATLVNVNVAGLEAGLAPQVTLTNGNEVRTVSANTAALRLAIGTWAVVMAERAQGPRNYRGRTANTTTLLVAAQTSPMTLALAYYCYRWAWQSVVNLAVFLDPNGHNPFVALKLAAHLLNVSWIFPEPAAAGAASLADQVSSQETVTISGEGAFVTVTGTRAANGAIVLTGTGTVAGFANVPVRLTGTMSSSGAISNGRYEMGQNTAPTGLPGGSIIYSFSTVAPSISGSIVEAALRGARTP